MGEGKEVIYSLNQLRHSSRLHPGPLPQQYRDVKPSGRQGQEEGEESAKHARGRQHPAPKSAARTRNERKQRSTTRESEAEAKKKKEKKQKKKYKEEKDM